MKSRDPRFGDPRIRPSFWAKVTVDAASGCWVWGGATAPSGYGVVGVPGERRNVRPHRVSYEALVGAVPPGLDLDHLCRNRACVNPAHLEPVTRQENLLRGARCVAARTATHCPKGHAWATSAFIRANGYRQCRECARADNRNRQRAPKKNVRAA